MKKISRVFALLLAVCLLAGLFILPAKATPTEPVGPGLTVLFTHDTHDHFYPDANGVGGYTRLATALKNERAKANYPTVTVDGGDFSMGSLFQTVYSTDAPELRALGQMGYDVVTLGNHEFDYRQKGLAEMLYSAKNSAGPLPAIVQANYTTPKDAAAGQNLTEAFVNYPVTPYTVVEKDGVRVAVFGVMGVDSDECAPMSGMTLEPMVDAAKRVVAEIKDKEAPDFIICLSHGGTEDGKGEDYELAKAVDGIDLIVSGHTHTTLAEPIVVNGTPIVSCGPYTQNLGSITLYKYSLDGEANHMDYKLIPIDDSIQANREMEALAEYFKSKVDAFYLSDYNLSYDGVLTSSLSDFTIEQTGNLIGEAYIQAVREVEDYRYRRHPVAFAVAPDGVIRGTLSKGNVTASQAFDILSLGSGADGSPGYPLVSVYLTGKDLKNVFEVDASISALMPAAELFGAGCRWGYNPNRMFLDRVNYAFFLGDENTGGEPIVDKKLYRVVADLYSGQMLAAVKDKSFGLLSITPRDEEGNPITDFEAHIIRDKEGRELKAWQAFASYLESQAAVEPPEATKFVKPSWNPVDLLFPMGVPTAVVVILIALVILAVVLIIRAMVRKRRGRSRYQAYKGKR